ncbi:hypothetical protein B0I35DRAFT_483147 [Stachybotrys elegans]|uniref:Uncharacterized protein n=1 Tax=Stachybotrys elegans TaxID=80388 RepID=A0A8K0WLW8_9HYPO|nr:hypothetical protein B0I35DRAFT_483147 [Stachybotrys elegans]
MSSPQYKSASMVASEPSPRLSVSTASTSMTDLKASPMDSKASKRSQIKSKLSSWTQPSKADPHRSWEARSFSAL